MLLLKNFKVLHMFFKERFACILFSYQCSFVLLINRLPQQLLYIITSYFLCQQLFSTFFDFIFALSTKALKTHLCFVESLLPCSATLDNIHPVPYKSQQHFLLFFQNGVSTKTHNFFFCFCATCTIQ